MARSVELHVVFKVPDGVTDRQAASLAQQGVLKELKANGNRSVVAVTGFDAVVKRITAVRQSVRDLAKSLE